MMLFYQSVIQSVVMFRSIAWLNGLTVRNLTKLNRVTKSASKIIGVDVNNVKSIYEAALLSKLKTIELDNSHPLQIL